MLQQKSVPPSSCSLLFTAITGLVYPLAMTGIAQVLFPEQAQRQPDRARRQGIGSALIGQEFTGDRYFHGRPSATTAPDPNDSTRPCLRPTMPPIRRLQSGADQQGLIDRVEGGRRQAEGGEPGRAVPSTSSPLRAAASIPTSRRRRRCSRCRASRRRGACRKIRCASSSQAHIEGRMLGIFGEPRVNVLALNLALRPCRNGSVAPRGR